MRRTVDLSAPFQTIDNTSRITGLSRKYIRQGVKSGRIPYVRAGDGNSPYMVNIPLLLKQLEDESLSNLI